MNFFDFCDIVYFEYLPPSRQLLRNATYPFWSVLRMLYRKKYGSTIHWFLLTILRHCIEFGLGCRIKAIYPVVGPVTIGGVRGLSPPLCFFSLLKTHTTSSGKKIWISENDKRDYDEGTESHTFINLRRMHGCVGEAPAHVFRFGWLLFWSR